MRRALVTGGSGSIGTAICEGLAQQSNHVIIHYNGNIDGATRVADSINNFNGSAEIVQFDIRDAAETTLAIEVLLKSGPIQILVNNAGCHYDAPMAGMMEDEWITIIDTIINGFFHVTKPILLPMMQTRWGRIVSISSVAGVIGNRGQTNYAAAKSALHGASKSLALEVASRGITVNVVAPGIIESPMTEEHFPSELIDQLVPMKRAGKADEVADLVTFLVSENAGYISGQVISINGAMA
ncbi:MAG: 3-oxoacyl-ACP reductase FabG [Candidatus Thiodiazotropha sp. (ex Lucinoma aequizonata)]|nr:3-oxoacyl-ACP reductase FabG [Candidatus Thiodiazotropha sp. (ex Lucinoma aequizonata)]MCU7888859.1 3-oxoacyl-ACP reductase FabG [Candidatus Thiodiazotropha sp. (ex Lucinoma aequizonata)]MCU7895698.1 3-oxoacyl-ACP reductase FabG [Candidatus Thiodiazotropha sp. (ex Lucinoma aequizonata)]MCU7898722.1 3-oxoacyl-ACP reductase FabG [Candidatus Thiodiazotropha sp. (ex Lucinoma aequizonata)]MCU7901497.1 3-oxoacyl-ACP reductase FabG [Candidatus Thiodiazotropha sp. (ex Lucinoma aequizonata)]